MCHMHTSPRNSSDRFCLVDGASGAPVVLRFQNLQVASSGERKVQDRLVHCS